MTTVEREQLITMLVERTGMDKNRVSRQLVKLVEHIQQAEAEQDPFEIEGFGTFHTDSDRLEFVPSVILSTEINNKYAGMKPIELIGAFKEPEGKDIPVAKQQDGIQEAQKVDDPPEKAKEAPASTDADSQQPDPAAPDADGPVPPVEITASDEVPPTGEETKAGQFDQEHAAEQAAVSASPEKEVEKEEKGGAAPKESLDKDPLGKAIVILVVILTLAVAGWLAYELGIFGSGTGGDPDSTSSADSPAVQREAGSQNVALSSVEAPADEDENRGQPVVSPGQEDEAGNEKAASAVEKETYGLYGDLNQDINGYFTIVVHSLRTMELAEEKKQPLDDEGYRTRINETDVNGNTYFRVGIGQFSTIQAAQEAVRELPEPYQSNNFINRF